MNTELNKAGRPIDLDKLDPALACELLSAFRIHPNSALTFLVKDTVDYLDPIANRGGKDRPVIWDHVNEPGIPLDNLIKPHKLETKV